VIAKPSKTSVHEMIIEGESSSAENVSAVDPKTSESSLSVHYCLIP
jgi:hypothetical protein